MSLPISMVVASEDLLIKRRQLSDLDEDSRRADWEDKHREEVQRSLGIDPNNNWLYDEDDGSCSEGPDEGD